jgi:hypothetical protein
VTLPRPSDPLEFVETHDVPLPSGQLSGFLPSAVNLYRSCIGLGWLAHETMRFILRGVIPYFQCGAVVFLSQVCS